MAVIYPAPRAGFSRAPRRHAREIGTTGGGARRPRSELSWSWLEQISLVLVEANLALPLGLRAGQRRVSVPQEILGVFDVARRVARDADRGAGADARAALVDGRG